LPHVITRACCNDRSCVTVCPVDCIHPADGERSDEATMLYIDPRTCIDCGACVVECPVDAIFPAAALPTSLLEYAAINAESTQLRDVSSPVPRRHVVRPEPELGPLTVAVIGCGPSGAYAATELLARGGPQLRIDMIERLTSPWGLARAGVAPDHLDTKAIADVFASRLRDPRVRFWMNVEVGRDVTLRELQGRADAVIIASGLSKGRLLGIANEFVSGSHSAVDFVGWYNGHPDHQAYDFDLSGDSAVIVGNGNVALDIARILVADDARLRASDMPGAAVEHISRSRIRKVTLVGRRSAYEAAFTTSELRALGDLPGVAIVARGLDVEPTSRVTPAMAGKRDLLERLTARDVTDVRRTVEFRFGCVPEAVVGERKATGLRVMTDAGLEVLDAGLVLSAVGSTGSGLVGADVDRARGTVLNNDGRVTGEGQRGMYVVGWAKRGPSGSLGTNRECSAETVQHLIEDALAGKLRRPEQERESLGDLLMRRGAHVTDWSDWRAIDREEVRRGGADGRPREKVVDLQEALKVIDLARREGGVQV